MFYVLQKHGKVPYKARLQASGVAFISMEDVKVVKKTATGPVSGSVFKAIWTKPNGEKVRFQPRYISFIKSAGVDIILWIVNTANQNAKSLLLILRYVTGGISPKNLGNSNFVNNTLKPDF